MANNLKDLSLEELLDHYRQGDAEAFREFYNRTKRLVYNFLKTRMHNNRADVDEVFQDTYLRVHKYIMTYDSSKKAINWLLTIAKNSLIDHYHDRKNEIPIDDQIIEQIKSPLKSDDQLIFNELLQQMQSHLSTEERELLIVRFIDGASYEEVSNDFGISPVNARQKISRLMKKLRESLVPGKI